MAMLREMRAISKYVFWVVAIAFVGWLGVSQVQQIFSGSPDLVLEIKTGSWLSRLLGVGKTEIRNAQFQQALQSAIQTYQARNGVTQLTAEDRQQLEDQVVEELVRQALIDQATRRLGITVTDDEIRDAAITSPPPEVYSVPDFQTNGQFDPAKWRRFLQSGANEEFKLQLEARYREQIPQSKLLQYITADLYVPDAKLWRVYRDQHDSVTVALLAIGPEQIPDSEVPLSDGEITRYFRAHEDQFKRPASAWLSFVAVPRRPTHADSAAARVRVDSLRNVVGRDETKFEAAARDVSADTVSGRDGGDLGWITRTQANFDTAFLAGLRGLGPGQVSRPVLSSFGYHLIRVDSAKGDSVKVRHILVPVELAGAHRDSVESLADSLDRIVAERDSGWLLDSAAQRLGLPVGHAPKLVDGDRMTLGRYVIPDISIWAFQHRVGETSPVIEAEPAYYVFRLDSVRAEGIAPLSDVRDQVIYAARLEKKRGLWAERARQLATDLKSSPDLIAAAAAHGVRAERLGPFTRLHPPPMLQAEPTALGTAFGLHVGERSDAVIGKNRAFILQLLARHPADSTAWLAQRDAQRESLLQTVRQARVDAYLAALRKRAEIIDRRKEIFRPQDATAGS
jgi:peptidyl-prolyl cis-trans isomerase D